MLLLESDTNINNILNRKRVSGIIDQNVFSGVNQVVFTW
jgi:hypothetical protein